MSFLIIETYGEPVGIRTRDLLIKSQLLYQLSYRPTRRLFRKAKRRGQPTNASTTGFIFGEGLYPHL